MRPIPANRLLKSLSAGSQTIVAASPSPPTYDPGGRPTAVPLGNGVTINFDYRDGLAEDQRLGRIWTTPTGFIDSTYDYYKTGSVKKVSDDPSDQPLAISDFSYDYADRLTTMTIDGAANSAYNYDDTGNLTAKTETGTPTLTEMLYDANAAHRLASAKASVGGQSKPRAYDYDNAGNLLKETEDSKVLHEFNYACPEREAAEGTLPGTSISGARSRSPPSPGPTTTTTRTGRWWPRRASAAARPSTSAASTRRT